MPGIPQNGNAFFHLSHPQKAFDKCCIKIISEYRTRTVVCINMQVHRM